ncbi:MAG TPA: HAD family hydrolase [Campylobacterales bacterium]|nr:HAD family hydrolase [Campylobacterales bacterium]
MNKCVILFDLDGTLIDSTDAIIKCFDDSFKHFGLPTPDDEKIKSLIGHPLDYMYLHLGIEKEKVWDFVDIYKMHYRERSKPMTYFLPEAVEAIKEAATFARLGIVTTKTGTYSRILLEHMGVMDYFEVLIGREDVTHPKPHPEPILKALHQMDVHYHDNVWMIGDTCLDIVSAKDAGVDSIGVRCGYGSEKELLRCGEKLQNNTFLAVKYIKKANKADIKSY